MAGSTRKSCKNNYFRSHSVRKTGSQNPTELDGAYVHQLELPYGVYSFIGIDACSKPGLHRPFNFFGYLNEAQIQHLKKLSALTKHSNQTIWFGHFPTSLIVHDPPILRQIMGNGIAYLCGHLHTMFGYVPNMFAKHKTGQLELELGDWKENRMFRVLVMDHDILTFTDAKLGDWPLVVITNPKDKQFISPTLEPIDLIATSSHIRIVAFSSAPIKMITVKLDNRIVGEAYQVWRGYPLYTLSWTPQLFVYGQHTIQVFVQDEMGRNKTIKQHFTLEIAEKKFGIVSRALLMLNIYSLGKLVFGLLVFFYVFILTSFRQCMCIRLYYLRDVMLLGPVVNSFLMKIWLAARTNVAYYILVGSVLYLTFGPWFIGHLLTDQLGVVFVWGILINGSFIPGGLTFFYGIFQFLSFNLPLTLILGHQLDLQRKHGKRLTILKHMSILAPAVVLLVITTKLALTEFPSAYGVEALLYGPLRTGNVLLLPAAVWLAYRTDLRKILAVNEPA
ncbi:transmembrane protein 62-like isoform X2 [Physella acuta]|uniref:transmembrane protein 62-like isoform X2 n=1 Tax=Physella acuta TaxID=109671 RepID=UPI0027DAD285|nr:transmembrane protein 62-like isoform X2 [Physella acuta]